MRAKYSPLTYFIPHIESPAFSFMSFQVFVSFDYWICLISITSRSLSLVSMWNGLVSFFSISTLELLSCWIAKEKNAVNCELKTKQLATEFQIPNACNNNVRMILLIVEFEGKENMLEFVRFAMHICIHCYLNSTVHVHFYFFFFYFFFRRICCALAHVKWFWNHRLQDTNNESIAS